MTDTDHHADADTAPLSGVRVLLFDVFGTVVDWRGTILREGEAWSAAHGRAVDWAGLADAWRAGYQPAMQRTRTGEIGWTNLDALHRGILDGLLPRFGLDDLDEAARAHLNRVWHRLDAWDDVAAGLARLKARRVIATLSNGNVSLLVDMAKHAALPWDCVLSAEVFRRYKPDLSVYRDAAAMLGAAPHEAMMVAAHPGDLAAAQRAGLRTAYVPRPLEHGPGGAVEPVGDRRFDLTANGFVDLAAQLDA